jgi:hypothetical protein
MHQYRQRTPHRSGCSILQNWRIVVLLARSLMFLLWSEDRYDPPLDCCQPPTHGHITQRLNVTKQCSWQQHLHATWHKYYYIFSGYSFSNLPQNYRMLYVSYGSFFSLFSWKIITALMNKPIFFFLSESIFLARSIPGRVSSETSFISEQPKLEPKLISALSKTRRLFRLFRFNIKTGSFGVSKQTKDQPKQQQIC